MKKALTLIAVLCMAAMLFAGCDAFPLPVGPTEPPATEEPTTHTHTPETDDGDCTTAILCAECGEEAVEAKEHVPEADDGDCTTAVKCVNCEKNAIEAKAAHMPEADDGDVTTPVKCENCAHICVDAKTAISMTIPAFENGAVATDKKNYAVGDTVTLTAAPAEGYCLKSFIVKKDGEVIEITVSGGAYSFVAEDGAYTVEAEFAKSVFAVIGDTAWDLSNQFNGSIMILNKTKTGSTVITEAKNYNGVSVTVKEYTPSKNEDGSLKQGDFSMQVAFIFDDGKIYEVRIHNTNDDGNYKIQTVGGDNHLTEWKWRKDLTEEQKEDLLNGDGVKFTVKLEGIAAVMYINDTKMATVDLGIAYFGKLAQIQLCMNGNKCGQDIVLPFELYAPSQEPPAEGGVALSFGEFTNGTVVADKQVYAIGDTATMAVAPAEGYNIKSLVVKKDGQAIDLGAIAPTGGIFSFTIEDGVYTVEAEFAETIFRVTNGNWDLQDQGNGKITILNKTKDGSTVITTKGGYTEASVTVKEYTPSKNEDGSLKQGNFSMQISFIFDNGKQLVVRMHNTDKDGKYKLQNMPEAPYIIAGWGKLAELTQAQTEKLLGEGVTFTVKRVGPNAELWVDGSKMATVALGEEYDGKLAQIKLCMNGNKCGQDIEIPFELK